MNIFVIQQLKYRAIAFRLNSVAGDTLHLWRLLTQFPQRMEIFIDRLERSELSVNVGLRVEREFQRT